MTQPRPDFPVMPSASVYGTCPLVEEILVDGSSVHSTVLDPQTCSTGGGGAFGGDNQLSEYWLILGNSSIHPTGAGLLTCSRYLAYVEDSTPCFIIEGIQLHDMTSYLL